MADLSQFRALLADHDDTTIAGMAGCSPEDVAAFRAAQAPAAPPAAAPEAPVAPAQKADKKKDDKKAAGPAPALPRSAAAYVAGLSLDDATALYGALHARLHPAPAERPAPQAVQDDAPTAVRIRAHNARLTTPAGKLYAPGFRDVISSAQPDLVAHLWANHRDAVEAYPVRR